MKIQERASELSLLFSLALLVTLEIKIPDQMSRDQTQ